MMFNRLVRTDLVLVIAVLGLFFAKSESWKDAILGIVAALFVFSISGHIHHFRLYKKFY